MIWLGALCLLLAVALAGYVAATERQMRAMTDALAVRGRDLRRLRLRFPTPAARALAREANGLIDEADTARREAAEERRLLGENLASFSHDVRTPLAGAQGFLQLYAVASGDEERNECVAAAAERLGAMRRLVDALFEFAKVDDGGCEPAREPVDVGEAVAAVLAELYPSFVARGWEPAVSLAEGVVVEADPGALGRIVENLLANCLRHGCAAPVIELRLCDAATVGDDAESMLPGDAAAADRRFVLAVSNRAEGLDGVDEGRLFERFYRGDASRRAGGSGLGLAIAFGLARASGLALEVSVVDATFAVTLSGSCR
ncbi:sensor histidine kinase [Adlercreutzia shanghongiae]|uniref:Sensor-like histidine kinase SenX3 n=1 Tax=Adlercreutzia shanghongiae TaxID=3111773 RepID=A0ABU6J208_9ACTN|nr:HAMP domain-containing sensor histidine kinase [Adlercreutzia sp. R22]MEC4295966.1 HAMP domain-containing sensor histidine kinase [Adlercreutzia sp. R22]